MASFHPVIAALTIGLAAGPGLRAGALDPVSACPSFNPLPELWGLREFSPDTRLDALGQSFRLYLASRAIFRADGTDGRVYLGGGRQVDVNAERAASEVAEYLRSHSCLCALEYRDSPSPLELHVAAGAYRLAAAPSLTRAGSGIVTVELAFAQDDEAGAAVLRGLVCWTSGASTVAPLAGSLPGFATLTEKVIPAFADPPVDDRPIQAYEIGPPGERPVQFALNEDSRSHFRCENNSWSLYLRAPQGLEALQRIEPARPGFMTFLRGITSGTKAPVDISSYFREPDPSTRWLERHDGVHFGRAVYWP